ncbi:hypothetical protein EF405_08755 [Cyclobacteriaceae bacterium YHN15]|nr:hypothetical protein EF405_08755 [Cyclobacteriaceae bacterium YHN15]
MAKLFQETNELDSCNHYALQALEIAKHNHLYLSIADACIVLSSIYQTLDVSKAFDYSMMAIAAKDSLYELNQKIAFENLTDFDEQERRYEIEIAETNFQNRLKLNVFLGSTFTLVLVAFFLYRNNRQKQKSKLQIEGAYNQLKSTQAQLIQSEKMASLGELTAGIAHEIQNPLNFVNNFSEVSAELLEEIREARSERRDLPAGESESRSKTETDEMEDEILEDIKQNLEKINHHGKRADAIVKGMLEHSRTGSGEKELTDINNLASEYLNLAYQSFKSKNEGVDIKLITDFDPTISKIKLVRADIGKVLLNILNNAFYAVTSKFDIHHSSFEIQELPKVTIKTKNLGNKPDSYRVEISISDNGPGIPDAIKDKIFQPFFTTKPTGQGTGLGLSLSYDIVKAHGGEIRVESLSADKAGLSADEAGLPAGQAGEEGKGTTFIITLLK